MYVLNNIKDKISAGDLVIGANVLFTDCGISELFGFAGCDFVWIDMEHAPLSFKDVEQHIIASHSSGAAAFVRIPDHDIGTIKRVMDAGLDGIIFPLVHSADEVKKCIEYATYPPKGIRGWNPIRSIQYGCAETDWYIKNVDSLVWKIIMLEEYDAVKDLDAILAVPGLDALIIGPSDLSASMGMMLQTNTEFFIETVQLIAEKTKAAGIALGVALPIDSPKELIERYIRVGVQFISIGQDANMLVNIVKKNISTAKEVYKDLKE